MVTDLPHPSLLKKAVSKTLMGEVPSPQPEDRSTPVPETKDTEKNLSKQALLDFPSHYTYLILSPIVNTAPLEKAKLQNHGLRLLGILYIASRETDLRSTQIVF